MNRDILAQCLSMMVGQLNHKKVHTLIPNMDSPRINWNYKISVFRPLPLIWGHPNPLRTAKQGQAMKAE